MLPARPYRPMFDYFRTLPLPPGVDLLLGPDYIAAVRGYQICSTSQVVFEALETPDGHSTTCSLYLAGNTEYRLTLGKVATRPLPPWISILPYGDERTAACQAYFEERYQSAHAAILRALPTAAAAIENGAAVWDADHLLCDYVVADELVAGRLHPRT